MNQTLKTLKKLGVHVPEILLPGKGVDMKKWAVIACDQYTSQPEYWDKVREEVGVSPSTLNLVLPEIYLKGDDVENRISRINETMERYLNDCVLQPLKPGFILVERSTPLAPSRKGLVMAVDLERYDYCKEAGTLIRATEGTVLERIPPRVKIRENALIELPHIMLLIDDPQKTVIEALYDRTGRYGLLYDFDLMQGGGHIKGWKVDDEESMMIVASAFEKLAGDISGSPMLFAVGDGNHSLSAAKAHWENVKAVLRAGAVQGQKAAPKFAAMAGSRAETPTSGSVEQNAGSVASEEKCSICSDRASTAVNGSECLDVVPEHPARYALVEVINVHDEGLAFEPIHRVLSDIDGSLAIGRILGAARQAGLDTEIRTSFSSKEAVKAAEKMCPAKDAQRIPFILEGEYGLLTVFNPPENLEAGTLQTILDELVKSGALSENQIDYVHGWEVAAALGSGKGCMGFFLPAMSKFDLFDTVRKHGALPRKTFSMGEAEEKRYYIECRRIR